MAGFRIIAVGRLRKGEEAGLYERFAGRLVPPPIVTEIAEGRGSAAEVRRREASALLAALPDPAFAVALDLGGAAPDSERFAREVEQWSSLGRPVCFLIGGAEGLDASVIQRADRVLSLGAMTWPHMLARAMLAEQLYRAQAIRNGHPYHKADRPYS
jgi:23S rRNA (pseudouridine1915-N3)-methyltransferase